MYTYTVCNPGEAMDVSKPFKDMSHVTPRIPNSKKSGGPGLGAAASGFFSGRFGWEFYG